MVEHREFVVGCLNFVLGATAPDSQGIVVTDLLPLTQVQLAKNDQWSPQHWAVLEHPG